MAAKKKSASKKATKKKVAKKKTTQKSKVAKKSGASGKKKAAKKTTSAKKKTTSSGKKLSQKQSSQNAASGPADFKPYQAKKGEEYMNEAQREHFRQILLGWKRELMEEVDRTVHQMQDEAANFPDPSDRATQESEFSLELRARDRERKLIKKIDESLAAIDEDDYGFCESCGIEIGIRRLEARPTATLCIDCKTLDEIRERQQIG